MGMDGRRIERRNVCRGGGLMPGILVALLSVGFLTFIFICVRKQEQRSFEARADFVKAMKEESK